VVEQALVLIYVCVLIVKTCHTSPQVCESYGFGSTADGVFIFFIIFALMMLVVLLGIGCVRLYYAGYVPKLILMANAYSVTPSQIVKRVVSRRAREIERQITHFLGLDAVRLTPRAAAAVLKFRSAGGRTAPSDAPEPVLLAATGSMARLQITGVFPQTTCRVQVDLENLAIRWSHRHMIHLHVVNVDMILLLKPRPIPSMSTFAKRGFQSLLQPPRTSARGSERSSQTSGWALQRLSGTREKEGGVHTHEEEGSDVINTLTVTYSDRGGISRQLELRMLNRVASVWLEALQLMMKMIPRTISPAFSRWAASCMAATSTRGAGGALRYAELGSILRCANASDTLNSDQLDEALRNYHEQIEQSLDIPQWLESVSAGTPARRMLGTREVTGLLLLLCSPSQHIEDVFERYGADGFMGPAEWIQFHRAEQHNQNGEPEGDDPVAMSCATPSPCIRMPSSLQLSEQGHSSKLTKLQFALQMLHPRNDATTPAEEVKKTAEVDLPLAQFWIASSHNTFCVGDQLTGNSSPDAYRRQLLQGLRHCEIDCWNRGLEPIVTHGHTFCSIEQFEPVAMAVSDAAFATSTLPVILSLEMHCHPPQQHKIARMMVKHLGDTVLSYDALCETGRAPTLSPLDLKRRILVKGKVKPPKKPKVKRKRFSKRHTARPARPNDDSISRKEESALSSSTFARLSRLPKLARPESAESMDMTTADDENTISRRASEFDISPIEVMASARKELYKQRRTPSSKDTTDEFYASLLCMRSEPIKGFLGSVSKWTMPITSVNEDRMLKLLGISAYERNQIEGLQSSRSQFAAGVTEEQQTTRAVMNFTTNPTRTVGVMQRRTAGWMLRPYPLGLRFSGKNMSPLIPWLAGAQSACLNFSDVDLAVTLHFALFNGSDGFVVKPPEMRGVWRDSESRRSSSSCGASCAENETSSRGTSRKDGSAASKTSSPNSCVASSSRRSSEQLVQEPSDDRFWPPPREMLFRASVQILALCNLPKRGEKRPSYEGSRASAHKYHPELSGGHSPPKKVGPSSPVITFSLHAIGGMCAVSDTLPLPHELKAQIALPPRLNGMNAAFSETVHCIAAEPDATFIRVGVTDGRQEVAYETTLLSRLRGGYRVIRLRGLLGTRIELCNLFVRVTFGAEWNLWPGARHLSLRQAVRSSSRSLRQGSDRVMPEERV